MQKAPDFRSLYFVAHHCDRLTCKTLQCGTDQNADKIDVRVLIRIDVTESERFTLVVKGIVVT